MKKKNSLLLKILLLFAIFAAAFSSMAQKGRAISSGECKNPGFVTVQFQYERVAVRKVIRVMPQNTSYRDEDVADKGYSSALEIK